LFILVFYRNIALCVYFAHKGAYTLIYMNCVCEKRTNLYIYIHVYIILYMTKHEENKITFTCEGLRRYART